MEQSTYNGIVFFLFVGAAALGVWFLKWKKNWPLLDRMLAAPLAAGFLVLLGMYLCSVLQTPFFGWNAARLAPSFALVKGYHLYYPSDSGPVLNTIYGPVTALAYLPATLAASPSGALVAGSLISATLFFGPMVWLTARSGKGAAAWAALLCFGFATYYSYPLRYSAFYIHADAPSLGLAGLACGALYLREREDDWKLLVVSATLAVLSVWAKQTMALVPVALAVWVLARFGAASFKRYLLALCGVGLVATAAFAVAFGPSAMWFNLFEIPSHHPCQGERLDWLLQASQELVSESLLVLAVIVAGMVLRCGKRSWLLFVLVGAFNIPAAILNRVKIGGDMNALSVSVYFWLMAAALAVVEAAEAEERGAAQMAKAALMVVVISLMGHMPTARLKNLYAVAQAFRNNQQEEACRILRNNSGTIYFPNNPLAHLMTAGKLYHFSCGLTDRRLGERPLTEEHFRANIPPGTHTVLLGSVWWGPETQTHWETMRHLPEFVLRSKDPYGWTVYLRTNNVAAPARVW